MIYAGFVMLENEKRNSNITDRFYDCFDIAQSFLRKKIYIGRKYCYHQQKQGRFGLDLCIFLKPQMLISFLGKFEVCSIILSDFRMR